MSSDGSTPTAPGPDDFDRRFAEIVAGLQTSKTQDDAARWPDPDEAQRADSPHGEPPSAGPPSAGPPSAGPAPQESPADGIPDRDRATPGPRLNAGAGGDHTAVPPTSCGVPSRWREWEQPDGLPDHFVPDPPPPLPAGDLHFWAIVAGLTLGPLLLVLANVLPVLDGDLWSWLGIGLSVAGFVLLVLRLPTHRDGDWGAQV